MDVFLQHIGALAEGESVGAAPIPSQLANVEGKNNCGVCTLLSVRCVLEDKDVFAHQKSEPGGDASTPYREQLALSLLHGRLVDLL